MVKQEAKDAVFGARLFYNGLMIFCVGIVLYYDNDLQKAILTLNFPYFLSYFALYALSYYLFYTCGENPGFLDAVENFENIKIELSTENNGHQEKKASLLEAGTEISSGNNIDLEVGDSMEGESQESNGRKSTKKKVATTTEDGMPALRYCEECQVLQPYRTKHCDKCEKCVRKFDHHCFWIGGCVGELNHRKFWLFLFFQSVLELWTWFLAGSGQNASYEKELAALKANKNNVNSGYATSEYGSFTAISIVTLLAFLFTGILLLFHTFLVLTNQTTWEFSKKDRITYLSMYPVGYYPFSQGARENIKTIFLHRNIPRTWELPPVYYESRRTKKFNWCYNEYWECC